MKLPKYLSQIDWKRVRTYTLFYTKAFLIILARLVYLLIYELARFVRKATIFIYREIVLFAKEVERRQIFPRLGKMLRLGALVTWLLSKKATKFVVQRMHEFAVFASPYIKQYSKGVVKYTRRFYKRVKAITVYLLLLIEKTDRYKTLKLNTEKYVAGPLLATATSRKPYAIALLFIFFITSSFMFLRDQRSLEAATAIWTQTDWSGGVGTSTTDEYSSSHGVTAGSTVTLTQNDWLYKKEITIDAGQVSGSVDLTDFPFLYSVTDTDLKSVSNGGSVAQTNGGDIKFLDTDGATQLDHELEKYDPATGEIIAWVRIPTVSYNTDTVIYLNYGNDAGGLDESNATGVWASNYISVLHLGESTVNGASGGVHQDSTSYNNDGTQEKNVQVNGKIGKGQDFDTSSVEYIDVSSAVDNFPTTNGSISLWVNATSGNTLLSFSDAAAGNNLVIVRSDAPNSTIWRMNGVGTVWQDMNVPIAGTGWNQLTLTWDSANTRVRLYKNGVLMDSDTSGVYTGFSLVNYLRLFAGHGWAGADGLADEFRLSSQVKTTDWIATEYANQNNPSGFSTSSSQQNNYSSWYNDNWAYRSAITIDATKIPGTTDLVNYPVLVNSTSNDWKSVANGGLVSQSNGGDIVFTNSAGGKLDHELDSYVSATGQVVAWVRIPSLSPTADTTIYMYYGNDAGGLSESDPTGTWSSDYRAVWHLGDGDSTASLFYQDSTSYNNDGTLTDTDGDVIQATGKIGNAIDKVSMDTSDAITVPNSSSLTVTGNQITYSLWVKTHSLSGCGSTCGFLGKGFYTYSVGILNTGLMRYGVGPAGFWEHPTSISAETWTHIAVSYNGSNVKFYANGVLYQTVAGSSNIATNSHALTIGGLGDDVYPASGIFDEVRVQGVGRSGDWIAAEYANQNDPSTFYTLGSPELAVGEVTSAAFDTGASSALIGSIAWTESLPAGTDIKFRIRTSPDGSTWSDWLGPTSAEDYYTDPTGGETINASHLDAVDDQYIQYRVFLSTIDGNDSPTLSDVAITYVANGAPDFNTDYPSSSAGGVSVSVATDGTSAVTINYSVRDEDGSSGTVTPGEITPSFEYSLNGGSTWTAVSSQYLGGSDLSDKNIEEVDYTVHTATWNAEAEIGTSVYVTNAKIRVTANDNEGGNNTATAISPAFTLDTTPPSLGSAPLVVDASVSPAQVTLDCTDDNSLEQKIGLESDLSDGDYSSYTGSGTQSQVGTPTDIVYGQCRDAYGNESTIFSVTTPSQPTNMYYQDISDTGTSDYKLFISWSAITEPAPGFGSYKVYRSTDGSSYSLLSTINSRTTNYLIDTGLSLGTTYYYKLVALDTDGSISAYSAVVSDSPDGQGGTDNTPPTISNTDDVSTPTEATITWTTNELSDSVVYYSATEIDPGTDTGEYAVSQGVGSYVTSHSVSLSNLTPGTRYYYLVRSTDVNSNIGTDSSSGTFVTGAGVSISAVSASAVYNEEATITWNTDAAADSTVFYSTNSDMSASSSLNDPDEVTSHSVVVSGLSGATTYYFYVASDSGGNVTTDKNIVDGITEYYSFATTSDSSSPTISSIQNALVGETGVTISWNTDEGATSQVSWGLTTSLGTDTIETAVYSTQHAVTLVGLENDTTYYYRVRSEDRANNTTVDNNSGSFYTVTTNVPGGGGSIITVYDVDTTAPGAEEVNHDVTKNSAIITFTTDEPAGVFFGWGPESASDFEINRTNIYQTSHMFTLTGLVANKTYYYKIITVDTTGNQREKTGAFRTLVQSSPDVPVVINPNPPDPADIDSPEDNSETENTEPKDMPSLTELARNASEGTVRDVLELFFNNSNLFKIPSDFLLSSASKLANNFGHSVVSNESLEKTEQEFLFENLRIAGITGQSATVVWKTTRPTKSIIYLTDLRTGQTRELRDNSFLLSHEYTITKLEATASYSVQIIAEDEGGTSLGSQALTFSTFVDKNPPVISDLKTTTSILPGKENKVQAIISWKTNKPTTSRVLYEAGVKDGDTFAFNSSLNQNFSYDHVVVVSGLQPGQVYRIRAESVDGQDKIAYSSDRTLITPRSKESIIDVIIQNFEQTFGFLGN